MRRLSRTTQLSIAVAFTLQAKFASIHRIHLCDLHARKMVCTNTTINSSHNDTLVELLCSHEAISKVFYTLGNPEMTNDYRDCPPYR